jgi:hypothetical protein
MWKPALFACLAVLALDMGCAKKAKLSEEEQAVASFKQIADNFVRGYKQTRHEETYHMDASIVMHTPEGWRKSYSELASDDYSVDVRKTDSLVSPYIGTLEFQTKVYVSELYSSQDAASQTTDFPTTPSDVRRHLHTYAYQNGAWVLQSRKQFVDEDWQDCPEGE